MYSPELETLDLLSGEDLPLDAVRRLFESDERFQRAIIAMLEDGEVTILGAQNTPLPQWHWRRALADPARWSEHRLSITEKGAQRA
jgi:hypothetical protein